MVDSSGNIIGEGAHLGAGHDHAEIVALHEAGAAAAGATMYVTLEPCSHHGQTPPCVESIIEAGLGRVLVGAADPDPRVAGSGVRQLREAGVEIIENVLTEESRGVDPAYFHHRETGMPRVTLKYAMTLDGSVAAVDATSRWITSEEARRDAHRLRAEVDAVVVGAGTLLADDPLLTVRLPEHEGIQPAAVIMAGTRDLPETARVWEREPIVVSATDRTIPSGRLVVVAGEDGIPDVVAACQALADLGHLDLLLEGGPTLAGAWWSAGVVTRGFAYLGAKMGGGVGISPLAGTFATVDDATVVTVSGVRSLGTDFRIDFEQG